MAAVAPVRIPPTVYAAHHAPIPARLDPPPTVSRLKFLLRKDFSDIYLFSNITPDKDAEDRAGKDRIWSADATAALVYTQLVEYPSPNWGLLGISAAPYVTLDKERHSNPENDSTDVTTLGFSGEVGLKNPVRGQDFIRGRMAVTRDDIRDVTTTHLTGEWIPSYLELAGPVFETGFVYDLRPELKVQYDRTTDSAKTLPFSNEQDAFRVGPEATLLLKFYNPSMPLHEYLRRMTVKVTYHPWIEVNSGHTSGFFNSSLIYNLDERAISACLSASRKDETKRQVSSRTSSRFR